jgi:hypothetical protein
MKIPWLLAAPLLCALLKGCSIPMAGSWTGRKPWRNVGRRAHADSSSSDAAVNRKLSQVAIASHVSTAPAAYSVSLHSTAVQTSSRPAADLQNLAG